MRWKAVGKIAGYVCFFLASVMFFFMLTFPEERLKDYFAYRIELATGYPTALGDFEVHGFSGVELFSLSFTLPAVDPLPEPPPEIIPKWAPADSNNIEVYRQQRRKWVQASSISDQTLQIDWVEITTSLLDAATGTPTEALINADLFGGQIREARVASGAGGTELEFKRIEGVQLGTKLNIRRWMPYRYDLQGTLNGSVYLALGAGLGEIEGTFAMEIKDAVIGEPQVVVPPNIVSEYGLAVVKLTDVIAGTINLELVAGRKGDIKGAEKVPAGKTTRIFYFKKMEIDGEDLKLKFSDRSAIIIDDPTKPIGDARLNVEMVFRLTDDFINREVERGGVEDEKPNSPLKLLLSQNKLRAATSPNGDVGFKCVGTLSAPNCNPSSVRSVRLRGGRRSVPVARPSTRKKSGRVKPEREMTDTSGRSTRDRVKKDGKRGTETRPSEDSVRDRERTDKKNERDRRIEEARKRREDLRQKREEAAALDRAGRAGRVPVQIEDESDLENDESEALPGDDEEESFEDERSDEEEGEEDLEEEGEEVDEEDLEDEE